jgi:hypothetical protein
VSVSAQNHAAPNFAIRKTLTQPGGDEPEVETFTGFDVRTQEALWAIDLVENHVEYEPYIQLYAGGPDNSEPSLITDPQALRALAAVLLANARALEVQTPGYTNPGAALDDVNALLEAWEIWNGDSWDLAAGLVAAHEVLTPRLAMMAEDVTAALDGDEIMQDLWDVPQRRTRPATKISRAHSESPRASSAPGSPPGPPSSPDTGRQPGARTSTHATAFWRPVRLNVVAQSST